MDGFLRKCKKCTYELCISENKNGSIHINIITAIRYMKVCRQRKQMNGEKGMNRIVDNLREKRAKRLI